MGRGRWTRRDVLIPILVGLLVAAWVLWALSASGWLPAWRFDAPHELEGDVLFAVIGDSGTGSEEEWAVAERMRRLYASSPFEFVLMLGDNIYPQRCGARPFQTCFEEPFHPLLDAGVKFYASLGNHDQPMSDLGYEPFHMAGRRYYSFTAGSDLADFFALDSEQMDARQLEWLESALATSHSPWKIAFFHKPIYNVGKQHGPNLQLREAIEPLFVRHGVRVVLSGHEHLYERLLPQQGIVYFVSGSAGHVNHNLDRNDEMLAAGDDTNCSFLLFALTAQRLSYRAITSRGEVIDDGFIPAAEIAR